MLGKLIVADVKMIVRNRQALFWALAFPILFATIFGLFRFDDIGEADVAVIGGASAAQFRAAVQEAEPLALDDAFAIEVTAREALEDGELDFVMLVGDDGGVRVLFDEGEADRNSVFLPVLRQIVDQANLRASGVPPRYQMNVEGIAGTAVQYYDFVLPGLIGMAVMTYGIIGLGGTIAQWRGQRILRRILATPLSPRTFLAAVVVSHLLLALVQSSLVMAWGVFLFDGSIRGNLLWIYAFVLLGNLTFLNIGFMVASRVQTAEAASGLGNAVAMPMMFFSGVFFPTAGLPWILPTLTSLLPLRPMVDAIRSISIDATSITAHWSELGQLLGWAVVTFVVAARMFRFERA